jgi:hypothetical protein
LQGSQLVAEGQILEDHVVVATAGDGDRPQEQQGQFKHVLILSGVAVKCHTDSEMTTFWRTKVGGLRILDDVGVKVHKLKGLKLHGKMLLADGVAAIVGSINFAAGSLDGRREA